MEVLGQTRGTYLPTRPCEPEPARRTADIALGCRVRTSIVDNAGSCCLRYAG